MKRIIPPLSLSLLLLFCGSPLLAATSEPLAIGPLAKGASAPFPAPSAAPLPAPQPEPPSASLSIHLPASAISDTLYGTVVDALTGDPVPAAHLWVEGSGRVSISRPDGTFSLPVNSRHGTLGISHIAFRREHLPLSTFHFDSPIQIALHPRPLGNEEIIVSASEFRQHWSGIYSSSNTRPVDDHMTSVPGLDMVTRANIAKDPVVRGLRDGRLEILIDGMRMTPACVDGMDPATAYIESDNLQAIQISRGQQSELATSTAPGGMVNFAMVRPVLKSGSSGSVETGYHSASRQRLLQSSISHGRDKWAFRLSGTWRRADDLVAGNGEKVSGSGLEKGNLFASLLMQPHPDHHLSLRYIGDFAGLMGYPRLLMDTRRADAHIAGLQHSWERPGRRIHSITNNLYLNRIEHWMDDYDRDVADREVMKGMYMPMYGETLTAGWNTEASATLGDHLFRMKVEAWVVEAFADMRMEPLEPGAADMRLINLGDVSQQNVALAGGWRRFGGNGWILSANLRLEAGSNRLRHSGSRSIFMAEYPGLERLEPSDMGYMIGVGVEKMLSDRFRSGIRLSEGRRRPTHMERYGYYIYQPLDGFFYHGNPSLGTERSRQADLWFQIGREGGTLNATTTLWVNHLHNYIAGERFDEIFKRYANMGSALLAGFEADLNLHLPGHWHAGASASWVFGQHSELDEPLPMIPPLKGTFFLMRESGGVSWETRVRWAAPQDRIARKNSLENRTAGYLLWDLYASRSLLPNLTLQAGVENLLDHHYTDHLSVNDMPGAGRNLQVALRFTF